MYIDEMLNSSARQRRIMNLSIRVETLEHIPTYQAIFEGQD